MRRALIASFLAVAACGGTSWKKTAGLPAGDDAGCTSVLVDADRIFVGTSVGLAVSDDEGKTWRDSSSGLPMSNGKLTQVEALTLNGTTMLAGTDDGTFASTDRGATWSPAGAGLPDTVSPYAYWNIGGVTLVGMNAGSQVVGMSGGIFRTANQGTLWTMSSSGLDMRFGASSFAQLSTTVFAAVSMAVARSTDDGKTWVTAASPGDSNPLSFATLDGTLYVSTATAGVFKTSDGIAFNAVNSGLPMGEIVGSLFGNSGKLYAGTDKQGVFMTPNGGGTWIAWSDGMTGKPRVVQFAMHGTKVIAATDTGGVWLREAPP